MSRPRKGKVQKTNSPFKKFRLRAKLSQEELADNIGVAVSTIRRWEKGQTEPTMTVAQMRSFCDAVKQKFEELPASLMPVSKIALHENQLQGRSPTKSKKVLQVSEHKKAMAYL